MNVIRECVDTYRARAVKSQSRKVLYPSAACTLERSFEHILDQRRTAPSHPEGNRESHETLQDRGGLLKLSLLMRTLLGVGTASKPRRRSLGDLAGAITCSEREAIRRNNWHRRYPPGAGDAIVIRVSVVVGWLLIRAIWTPARGPCKTVNLQLRCDRTTARQQRCDKRK